MALVDSESYYINARRLKEIRYDLGLSQTKLASLAGYSDRLIRKAESIGRLSGGAIVDIVQTLNEMGAAITIQDLMLDPVSICVGFMNAYADYGADTLQHCHELFAPDFQFVSGGSLSHPRNDCDQGLHEFARWLDLFFAICQRKAGAPLNPRYFREKNEVFVCFHETLLDEHSLWINLHVVIQCGLISRITTQYDTEAFLDLYRKSQDFRVQPEPHPTPTATIESCLE